MRLLSARPSRFAHPVLWSASAIVWCLLAASGFGFLWKYETTPGPATDAPAIWPSDSRLSPTAGRPCLIVALHPRCSCSRATLTELEEIRNRCGEHLDIHVLFYTPAGCGAQWAQTDLWDRVTALPGVAVWIDEDGRESQRFGAATSGHVVLYGADGRLLFQGGITWARGQIGDNDGCEAVIAHVLGTTKRTHTDVYGCPLCQPPLSGTNAMGENECKTMK